MLNGSLGFVQTSPKIQINSKFFSKFYQAPTELFKLDPVTLSRITSFWQPLYHIQDFVMRINTCALETKFLQGPNKHSFDNVTQNLRQSQKSRPSLELYPIQFFSIDNWLLSKKCPPNSYLFKVNNTKIRKKFDICSKFTIKTIEWRHWRRSCVFIVNFEHISHLSLLFLLLTLNK